MYILITIIFIIILLATFGFRGCIKLFWGCIAITFVVSIILYMQSSSNKHKTNNSQITSKVSNPVEDVYGNPLVYVDNQPYPCPAIASKFAGTDMTKKEAITLGCWGFGGY
jgi:hypothetical protein